MTLRILDLAEADLLRGLRFYQRKSPGVGWYFLDSLSAEQGYPIDATDPKL